MPKSKNIPLFWWSEMRLMGKQKENYGDLLSKYIVEKISGKQAKWVHPQKQAWYNFNKQNYLGVGSILHHSNENSIVWGSGIIDRKHSILKSDFRAVRGPETRKYLISLGYECPEIYGDPALLLPELYSPKINLSNSIGIVPHHVDYQYCKETFGNIKAIKVIDLMTNDIQKTTDQILSCERIISSSLHGLIVAHAYGIPAIWVKFSNKLFGDDIKFIDYFKSLNFKNIDPAKVSNINCLKSIDSLFQAINSCPDPLVLEDRKRLLMKASPFT